MRTATSRGRGAGQSAPLRVRVINTARGHTHIAGQRSSRDKGDAQRGVKGAKWGIFSRSEHEYKIQSGNEGQILLVNSTHAVSRAPSTLNMYETMRPYVKPQKRVQVLKSGTARREARAASFMT